MRAFIIYIAAVIWVPAVFSGTPEAYELQPRPLEATVVQDPKIEWLLEAHTSVMQSQNGFAGFRIQVAMESGNQSRVRIQRRKYDFDNQFPEVKSYIDYDAPYYKLRVGDFRTRLDARRFMRKLSREYSNAFIVVDKINFPEFE